MGAGWYNTSWPYRAAITIDATAKGTSPIDVTFAIPTDWDLFWSNVLSSGNDVRVTAADGITLLTYDLDSFNTTTRVGTIEIDNLGIQINNMMVVYVYWGYASAADARTAFAPASAVAANIALEAPVPARTLVLYPERPGALRPAQIVSKQLVEAIYLYWDVTPLLANRQAPYNSDPRKVGVLAWTFEVNLAGAAQGGMTSVNYHRILEYNGRTYIRTLVQAGADGSDYQLNLLIGTTLDVTGLSGTTALSVPQYLTGTAWLKVRDTDEA